MYHPMYYPPQPGQMAGGFQDSYAMNPYIDQRLQQPYNQSVYPYPMYHPEQIANFATPQTYSPYSPQFQYGPYEEEWMYEYIDDEAGTESTNDKTNRFLAHFQTEEGQYDFDKIFSTAGQFIGIVRQVTPMVSQIGTLVRVLRP